MTKVRGLLALLAVVAIAAAILSFFAYRSRSSADAGVVGLTVADGNFANFFDSSISDAQLVAIALQELDRQYYKPVDPQAPLRGERRALLSYLRDKHIQARLPAESATGVTSIDASRLDDELAYAQSHYGSKLPSGGDRMLLEQALSGIMDSVDDPYTVYLSPREIEQLNEALQGGNFGGIGVYIYPMKGNDVFLAPIAGLPAARAGMKTFEVLDSVDGVRVHGLSLDRIQELIRGPAGTRVSITAHALTKPKQHFSYRIVREIIHVPTVHAKMEDGYDYIRLSEFGDTSAAEMHAALLDGRARGAKGYILDLRDNGGGLVDTAVSIVSYFVPAGRTVVAEVDRDGNRNVQVANGSTIPGLHPLVILVNKYTASASEITAGALQDYGLATLIGTQTFGKGVVQSIYTMPGGAGALKITTASYVTPYGRNIEHRGIKPNIVVDQSLDPALIDTAADRQLAAAKAWLRTH
jgi:carboxyl-terminal processing protease